jgi:hypothetical protein
MSGVIETLRSRWQSANLNPTKSHIGRLAGAFNRTLDGAEEFPRIRAKLTALQEFSPLGLQKALRMRAEEGIVRSIYGARRESAGARGEIEAVRAKALAGVINKGDLSGAVLRQVIRAHLRGLEPGERMALRSWVTLRECSRGRKNPLRSG